MHRILLEAMEHEEKCFVTLTYDKEHLPDGATLSPKDVQDWLKRLRKVVAPRALRYFVVGEYGEEGRPHYHVALYGWGSCAFGGRVPIRGRSCTCKYCSVVKETWRCGHVMLGSLTADSAQYIAGYVLKKMTRKGDIRLNGRYPEFARMSLKPGIGANAMFDVASVLMRVQWQGAVPATLLSGRRELPLGRYLRRKLAVYSGQDEKEIAKHGEEVLSRLYEELQVVRGFAWAADRSVKSVFQELNAPVERSLAAKQSFKRRSL